ncbi:hypothetical protein C9J85_11840 [Haloferax sp. wsp5]|nr:hypothetical protein C9J85_11840 [Haloferax sp. wsp5]
MKRFLGLVPVDGRCRRLVTPFTRFRRSVKVLDQRDRALLPRHLAAFSPLPELGARNAARCSPPVRRCSSAQPVRPLRFTFVALVVKFLPKSRDLLREGVDVLPALDGGFEAPSLRFRREKCPRCRGPNRSRRPLPDSSRLSRVVSR